ncbi:MAG: hypothetical protein ACYTAF_05545 [Planctomycetota bacterium]
MAGCTAQDQPLGRADRGLLKKPEGVIPFVRESFELRHWADAHKALSPDTAERLPYEAFYAAFASRPVLQGVVLQAEAHGEPAPAGGERRIRVCNRDYGFSEEFHVVPAFGGAIWTLRITPEQQDLLTRRALEWWEFQYREAGDFYVYPRDVATPKMWAGCPCNEGAP